jgi:calcineurin-like phosphoesterase family protein
MSCVFLISDTHFGHANILTFKRNDGTPLRPFATIEEHDETLVANWNSVVRPCDKVYHLGDVVIHRRFLNLLGRCHGHKRLIRGNHDIFRTKFYLEYFDEVYGVRVLDDMILSHIPLAIECITKRFGTNVHGHLHSNVMDNPRYFNVSCEQINYTPISLEDLRLKIKG